MAKLILFEIRKYFTNIKTYIVWLLLVLVLLCFVIYSMALDKKYDAKERKSSYSYDVNISTAHVNEKRFKYFDIFEQLTEEQIEKVMQSDEYIQDKAVANFWRQDSTYSRRQIGALETKNRLDEIYATILKDENMIQGMELGIVKGRRIIDEKVGRERIEGIDEIKNRLEYNYVFYNNNIVPMNSEYEMNALNFLRQVLVKLFKVIIPFIIILLCFDSVSKEFESGSFKMLLLQPFSREKIYYSKFLSSLAVTTIIIFTSIFLVFILLGLFNGFGEWNYPVKYNLNHYNTLLSSDISYSNIATLITNGFFFAFVYIVFIVAFIILLSMVLESSISSLCLSMGIIYTFYIIESFIFNIPAKLYIIPFFHSSITNFLDGSAMITSLSSFVIILTYILLLLLLAKIIINKKDICC